MLPISFGLLVYSTNVQVLQQNYLRDSLDENSNSSEADGSGPAGKKNYKVSHVKWASEQPTSKRIHPSKRSFSTPSLPFPTLPDLGQSCATQANSPSPTEILQKWPHYPHPSKSATSPTLSPSDATGPATKRASSSSSASFSSLLLASSLFGSQERLRDEGRVG